MRTVLLLKRKSTHLCEPIYVRPHTRVRECVCTRVYMCVYTCVSTPYLLVTRLSRSLLHVTRRPQRHCRAVCSTWVPPPPSPGDPGAAGPRPAGPRGACLSQCALQPRPRMLHSGSLSPRAPRLPNHAAAGFSPPHPQHLCCLLTPAPGEGSADAALRWASPVRSPKALLWQRRMWDTTQKAPAGRSPTEWGCCPPLGRRCRPRPAGLGGGCEPMQELGHDHVLTCLQPQFIQTPVLSPPD